MVFEQKVDDEISIALVQESFAAKYVELAKYNYDYLVQWLAWPRFCQTEEDFKSFVQQSLHKYANGESITCAMLYKGEIVGNVSFNSVNHTLKKVEVGYWLVQSQTGKGIVTRTVRHMMKYAFDELDMSKIQINAAEHNIASRNVCERLGLRLEGVISHCEVIGEQILSHAIYAIQKDDFNRVI